MNMHSESDIRCRRTSCKFYKRSRKSGCEALAIAYEDDQKCKFFKKKEEEKL